MTVEPAPAGARKLVTTVWWIVLVEGLLAVAFGLLAILATNAVAAAIMVFFGVYSLLDGALALYGGFRNRDEGWGWLVFQGIAGIAVGVLALRHPSTTAIALTLLVAFWALVVGFIRIFGALELRKLGAQGWGWALIAGIATLMFGIALVVSPLYGAKTLLWLIGITVLIFGIALVINAFLVRKVVKDFADDGIINNSNG